MPVVRFRATGFCVLLALCNFCGVNLDSDYRLTYTDISSNVLMPARAGEMMNYE